MQSVKTGLGLGAVVLVISGLLGVACGDSAETDGNGGEGGASSGGAASGGAGGDATGGTAPTCEPPVLGGGGAGGEGGSSPEGIEIAGSYTDDFGGEHTVTATAWESLGVFTFSQVNNEENFAIARNDEENAFNPCLWSRYEWVLDGGDLFYCQSVYAGESEQAAIEAPRADASDLAEGCSGFAWSQLAAD